MNGTTLTGHMSGNVARYIIEHVTITTYGLYL